jgi:hypothetical protein
MKDLVEIMVTRKTLHRQNWSAGRGGSEGVAIARCPVLGGRNPTREQIQLFPGILGLSRQSVLSRFGPLICFISLRRMYLDTPDGLYAESCDVDPVMV